jgi:molybdopterin-guanine dinucleotide biosynthesis protein A
MRPRRAKASGMQGSLGVVVLAGGTSRRLGPNKLLEKVGKRSMLTQAIMTALEISNEVIVVAGNPMQEAAYQKQVPAGVVVVRDKIHQRGPLIGLYTGLEKVNSEYAAVLPSDCPFVKKGVILYLNSMAKGVDAAVPVWPDGKIEPLHSVFRVASARAAAIEAMKAETDTIREMIQHLDRLRLVPMERIKELDPTLLTFLNVNTQEDLERARRISSQLSRQHEASVSNGRR